ncbi:MAG: RluA family pseudouridine synthase [Bdellovibrionota bacterium]
MKHISHTIAPKDAGLNIDLAWVKINTGLSRRKIRQIIDSGGAYCNGKRIRFASYKVKVGDELKLIFDLNTLKNNGAKDIIINSNDILYEDGNLIALNKPPSLASQPTKNPNTQTVIKALMNYYQQKLSVDKLEHELILCHRLDLETSGVLLIAKSKAYASFVMDQFKEKLVSKTYHAICVGIPKKKKWTCENYLSLISKKTGLVKSVRAGGRWASTSFEVLGISHKHNLSLIACHPVTGRSHQIRVHLADLDLPILGDKKYGGDIAHQNLREFRGLSALISLHHMLHARKIRFKLESKGNKISLTASYPDNFAALLKVLGRVDVSFS